jgi:hypothetical protein
MKMAVPLTRRAVATWPYLWSGTNSVLGFLASLASLSVPRRSGGIAICRSSRGFARWFLTQRGYCAITLGHVVLMTPESPPDILAHEMVHVRQGERWGPLFLPLYLLSMGLIRARGGHPYWDNPFEVEARGRAGEGN